MKYIFLKQTMTIELNLKFLLNLQILSILDFSLIFKSQRAILFWTVWNIYGLFSQMAIDT